MATALAKTNLKKPVALAVLGLEFCLAIMVVIGTAWYLFMSLEPLLAAADSQIMFALLIQVFLSAVIGIEVARVLITHNLFAMFDVFGLILVRKALDPTVTAPSVLLVVIAFSLLVFVYTVTRWWCKYSSGAVEDEDVAELTAPTSFFNSVSRDDR